VAEPAVFNASPLIFLAQAALTDLTRLAGEPMFVPRAVIEEIEQYGSNDPTAKEIRKADWLNVVDAETAPSIIERWDLGRGETSVLTWAYNHRGTTAVLDDLAARRCARSLAIPLRGTLGLVLIAKQRQLIPAARPILEQLRRTGMYLSDRIMNHALRIVGE